MESPQVEYKKSFGKEVIISLAAFANAEGGRIIVGVDDKGNLCGVDVVFDDRISFANPGLLYGNLRLSDLERDDYVSSIRNRLMAEAFYLTGDIERYGTGFVRIRESLKDYPELALTISEVGDFFKVELGASSQLTPHVTPHVEKLLYICEEPVGREELQKRLGIKDRKYFYDAYLSPALLAGLLELTIPGKPKSKLQQYRLTESGRQWVEGQQKRK